MMKNVFKRQKPRQQDVVKNEYYQACARAGQVQYDILVREDELRAINKRLELLNKEFIKAEELKPKVEESKDAEEAPKVG